MSLRLELHVKTRNTQDQGSPNLTSMLADVRSWGTFFPCVYFDWNFFAGEDEASVFPLMAFSWLKMTKSLLFAS